MDILYAHAAATSPEPFHTIYHKALQFIAHDGYQTHHCELKLTGIWRASIYLCFYLYSSVWLAHLVIFFSLRLSSDYWNSSITGHSVKDHTCSFECWMNIDIAIDIDTDMAFFILLLPAVQASTLQVTSGFGSFTQEPKTLLQRHLVPCGVLANY